MKLELKALRKVYANGAIAVDNIDLSIADGQMAVLLGPSGCGKTTLLRLISGLERPEQGSIMLDNKEITDWEPKTRDIAMVFQNYALYPHMTVRQNLEFGLKSRNIPTPERDKSVAWAAKLLSLEPYLNRRPKELSGGQRQRVALGRAIVRKPKLYLFDEPLSNLDAELRMRMRGEILALHRNVKGTSIYVTHDQVEAMSLADIIFIMRNGKIVASGTPHDLYDDPPDLFTAGFLGFPAMNLLEGSLADNNQFISANGLTIKFDKQLVIPPIAAKAHGGVVFGIRPEDIDVKNDGRFSLKIISVENLGPNVLLLTEMVSGDRFKIVAHGDFHIGESVSADLALQKSYLFERDSGKRIL